LPGFFGINASYAGRGSIGRLDQPEVTFILDDYWLVMILMPRRKGMD